MAESHRLLGWASLDPAADSINTDASAPKQDADKPATAGLIKCHVEGGALT